MENYIVFVSGSFIFTFGSFLLYLKIRPRYPVTVTCWFCGASTSVPHGNSNCWDCPKCDQYNGFTKNGDYNKPIPAQYDESLNYPVTMLNKSKYNQQVANSPRLCDACNLNQEIKINLLRDFVPKKERNYEQEVAVYKKHLEDVYGLCKKCDMKSKNILAEQTMNLWGLVQEFAKNQALKKKDVSSITSHILSVLTIIMCCEILRLTVLMIYSRNDQFIPLLYMSGSSASIASASTVIVTGLLTSVGATLSAGKDRLHCIDALCCMSWVLMQALHSNWFLKLVTTTQLFIFQVFGLITVVGFSFSVPLVRLVRKMNHKKSMASKNQVQLPPYWGSSSVSFPNLSLSASKKKPKILKNSLEDILQNSLDLGEKRSSHSTQNSSPMQQKHILQPAKFIHRKVDQNSSFEGSIYSKNLHQNLDYHQNKIVLTRYNGLPTPPPSVSSSVNSTPGKPNGSRNSSPHPLLTKASTSYVPSFCSWPPKKGVFSTSSVASDNSSLMSTITSRSTNSSQPARSASHEKLHRYIQPVELRRGSRGYLIKWILVGTSFAMNVILVFYYALRVK